MKLRSVIAILIAVMLMVCGCSSQHQGAANPTIVPLVPDDGTVIKSEHCTVTDEMLEYIFYYNFYNDYADLSDYYALSLDLTFTEQMYSKGVSWQQHLSELALNTSRRDVLLMEAGIAAGFDFEPNIDSAIAKQAETASGQGMTLEDYYKSYYGDKVTEQVVRDVLEIQLYASEYSEYLKGEYTATLTEADYTEYYQNNRMDIEIVDVLTYSIPMNYNGIMNTEKRDSLLACSTEEEFKAWIAKDLTEKNEASEEPKTPEELSAKIEEKTAVVMSYYTEGGEFSEWAFAKERELCDTHYVEKNTGMYDIYMLVRKPYAQEKYTHNVGSILLTAANYPTEADAANMAEQIISEFNAGGCTAEIFEELAEKYNEDEVCFSYNVADDFFDSDIAVEWLRGERKEGDTTAFVANYGYYVVYYAGKGQQRWVSEATQALAQDYINKRVTEFEGEYADTLTVNEQAINALPEALPGVM